MLPSGSITAWLCRLQTDEELALSRLHQRLWPLLLERARRRLKKAPIRFANEEDVAQEAFWAFCTRLKAGLLPRLSDRHDLLAFLTHVIACKACNLIESELGTKKRGGGRVQHEAALDASGTGSLVRVLEQFEGKATDPLENVLLDDCYNHFVMSLGDGLRQFAELHLLGSTNREIAAALNCDERTVARKLALIRARWSAMVQDVG
jgi:DNA-directed RNA polymerase specialized sigma24 family protein